MEKLARLSTKAELTSKGESRMSKVIDYGNGNKVEIPINKDGTVKWFDDSKLLRRTKG